MAITAGTVNSSAMKIYTGATPTAITCLTNASVSMSLDMRDITCKDSASDEDNLPGRSSWGMSGDGMFAFDATNGARALWQVWKNKTLTSLVWQNANPGDYKYSGSGYITKLDFSAPGTNENTTYSFEFKGIGAMTETLIP